MGARDHVAKALAYRERALICQYLALGVCWKLMEAGGLDYHGWECNCVSVIEEQVSSVLEVRVTVGWQCCVCVIVELVISVYTVYIVDKISRQNSTGAD
jgi:hypothetical protein